MDMYHSWQEVALLDLSLKGTRKYTAAIIAIIFSVCISFLGAGTIMIILLWASTFLDMFSTCIICFLIFLSLLCLWITAWEMIVAHISTRTPVFLVNAKGIYLGKLPFQFSDTFIEWREIRAITVYHASSPWSNALCIHLKNANQFFSQFNVWKKLNSYFTTRDTSSLFIPQYYIHENIEEILYQISCEYTSILTENNISLHF